MVGAGADDPHADPIALIPASETIHDIYPVAGIEIVNGTFAVDFPDLKRGT
jgi:hypothetical protein